MSNPLAELADVFFNGRPYRPEMEIRPRGRSRSWLTFEQLLERGVSHVKYGDKIYRVTVEEKKNDPA